MIDIHMHVIPGVDDGSVSLEMSLQMLEMAYAQGVRAVIATSHSNEAFAYDAKQTRERYKELQVAVRGRENLPKLYLGCEVACAPYSMDTTIRLLQDGTYPTLNETRYVLTEFGTQVAGSDARAMTERLKRERRIPVIAHVERYKALSLQDIRALTQAGCLLQINAFSLEGESDPLIGERARELLAAEMVSFLGSDAHRINHRAPNVAGGVRYIREHCSEEYTGRVLEENAQQLLLAQARDLD